MHRDRPVHGIGVQTSSRPPHEREADYFAACFLVPESLLADALDVCLSHEVAFRLR